MNTLLEKIDAFKKVLDEIDAKNKELDALSDTMQQLKQEVIQEMTEEEVPSVTRGDFTFSIVAKTKYSKVSGSELALFATLREHGLGDLIQESVNAQRLNAAMNAEAENNDGVLATCYDGLINTYSFQDISKRKSLKRI